MANEVLNPTDTDATPQIATGGSEITSAPSVEQPATPASGDLAITEQAPATTAAPDPFAAEQQETLRRQREERRRADVLRQQEQDRSGLSALAFLIALFMGMDGDESLASEESTNTIASSLGLNAATFRQTVSDYRSGQISAYEAASSTISSAPSGGISETQINAARGAVARYATTGNPLLELIASKESNGNYNVVYGGRQVNLTSMTVDQVLAWQKDYVRGGSASSAAGKYQIISTTLAGLKREMGLTGNERFDEAMQDRMATVLLNRRGYSQYLAGRLDERTFMRNLAAEWASMPKDASGRSYYAGDGLNKALVDPATFVAAIRASRGDQTTLASAGFPGGVDQTTRPPNASRDGLTPVHTATLAAGGTDQVALAARTETPAAPGTTLTTTVRPT